jgi:hypothetical protein
MTHYSKAREFSAKIDHRKMFANIMYEMYLYVSRYIHDD